VIEDAGRQPTDTGGRHAATRAHGDVPDGKAVRGDDVEAACRIFGGGRGRRAGAREATKRSGS